MIVADAGPIIAFARIGRLDLLEQVLGELVIPDAVYADLVTKGIGKPGADEVAQSNWIRRLAVTDHAPFALLPSALHHGEREAIVLAQEHKAQLLIDEKHGRQAAVERGLVVFGSLRVLTAAKRQGLIDQVNPVLEAMLSVRYWIDVEIIPHFLRENGESDE